MPRHMERLICGVLAAASGWLYWQLLAAFWVRWTTINPIAAGVLSPTGVLPIYRWVLYPTDWATSVLVSLPFATLLVWLARRHLWLCIVVASLTSLIGVNWPGLLSAPATVRPTLLAGVLLPLTFLPAAAWLALLLRRRFAPNNSSKPTPLRGAA